MSELITHLLSASDNHLDVHTKEVIRTWSTPYKAVELLHTLDVAVYGGGASPLIMTLLETLLREAIKIEETTYEEVVKQATWRNDGAFS